MFAYKLKYVLNKAHELIDFTDYQDLFNKYDTLQKISFDYAVVEKEDKIQVQRFAGQWMDLGTWNTLTEAMEEHVIGKSGNPFTFRVVNDRLAFYMNNTEVAYLSNNKLYVTQAEILTRLQVGKFAFEPQTNGNLSLIYTG